MQMKPLRLRALALVTSAAVLMVSGWASADPPSRVARLGYTAGAVSFSPAGENDWVRARINRPLSTGDRLWADGRARAEIQVGGAVIRMNGNTSVALTNLDDRIAQLQLTQGTLNIRVRRLDRNQAFEVDTPNLAFTLRQPGEYRITVDPQGYATDIFVRRGQGEAYGEGAAYVVDSRQSYRFTGTGLRDYEYLDLPRYDDFDRWSSDRDRRYDNSSSARYVSQDVVGYEDLDSNGTWRVDNAYGNVWIPNRVAAGWAPYRDGHWAWIDPWGWTWVDDAPWGYAVSHYGRWTNLSGTWGWVPGPVRSHAYYAPALVAFVGGNNFQLSISSGNGGGVAWFPLAPREIYQPSYVVSRDYFENINRSNTVINNTVINNTVINNTYNNSNVTNVVYANRQVPGAVIAVPTAAFVQSQPVSRAAVQVSREMLVSAPVAAVPRVAPTAQSVLGAAAQASQPPAVMFDRPVVARTAPPPAQLGFAAQRQQLTVEPGNPLNAAARRELKPMAVVPAPVVKVVAPSQVAPPTALPPRVAPAGSAGDRRVAPDERGSPQSITPAMQTPEQRGRPEQRGNGEQRGQTIAPPPPLLQRAAPQQTAPGQFVPPGPSTQPPEQRGRAEQRGNGDQRGETRGQPVAPPPPLLQRTAPQQNAPGQFVAPAPSAQPPEQRGRPEQRGNGEQRGEQRGQPVAPPPPPIQRAAPVQVAPVPVAALPPAPAAEQRGRPEQRGNNEQRAQPVAQPSPQRIKIESAPVANQADPRPPVAAPRPPQPVPRAEPRGPEPKPVVVKQDERKKDKDEQKRDEENRRLKD